MSTSDFRKLPRVSKWRQDGPSRKRWRNFSKLVLVDTMLGRVAGTDTSMAPMRSGSEFFLLPSPLLRLECPVGQNKSDDSPTNLHHSRKEKELHETKSFNAKCTVFENTHAYVLLLAAATHVKMHTLSMRSLTDM